ncbi:MULTISPECIES: type II asparaginase [Bacillus]|jgi:L-asparaginase|uniref:type II asparaginase n=1 Tax=Bacillus TaxID=1386 RepID=UPI000260B728|nr:MULTISPECIES: type II asparaginase [Bacillus]EMI14996.1 l-asparaginase [Bacillus stratosphericus LAMA 585]KQL45344.1 L-asparaginase [Bacillus sp. FJAT-21955]MBX7000381.1 type II asparaginase [Bacillus aerophilus]MCA1019653.1 type II asparaginase [Bacillus stratosphericus]EIL83970.1 L-asparaginase 2 [Bacillus sp. M 2-6]
MNVTKWFGAALLSVSLLVTAACANDSTQENNQSNQESTTSETKEKNTAVETGNKSLSNIKVLATGGTIAGSSDSNTDTTGYKSGALGIDKVIASVPQLKDIANVTGEQVANVGSENVDNALLLKLAKRVNQLLNDDQVDGIVVTHGTDTLEETAYFLHLVVKSDKPVVVVGSMRPASAISADGPLNLYHAVKIASTKEAKGKGVMVTLNDRIASARFITKTNTTTTDSFKSLEQGYIGEVAGEVVSFYNEPTRKHTADSEFDISKLKELPQVDILYGYQNDQKYVYDAAVKAGAKGIVVAAAGNGTMSTEAINGATDAVKKDVVIVRSSRAGNGIVTHEKMDDEHHFVSSDSLNPQKARILLMLALTKTKDPDKIQSYYEQY